MAMSEFGKGLLWGAIAAGVAGFFFFSPSGRAVARATRERTGEYIRTKVAPRIRHGKSKK